MAPVSASKVISEILGNSRKFQKWPTEAVEGPRRPSKAPAGLGRTKECVSDVFVQFNRLQQAIQNFREFPKISENFRKFGVIWEFQDFYLYHSILAIGVSLEASDQVHRKF